MCLAVGYIQETYSIKKGQSKLALFDLIKHDQSRKVFTVSSNKDHTILVVQQVSFEKYRNTVWSYNLQQQLIN